jgi:hypothetical protein
MDWELDGRTVKSAIVASDAEARRAFL